QASGISSGRHPDGGSDFYPLKTRTPGARNGAILVDNVVINEIMYDPISGDNDDEYVELYNKGPATVDLSFWRFTSGISFFFPTNTRIGSSNYLVIARNTARLMSNYPNLNTNNLIGSYSGSLANSGERLALGRPDVSYSTNVLGEVSTNLVYVVVDEVTYDIGGQWGAWHHGDGSSLELIDANSDHRLAYNWTGSDETSKADWTTVAATGMMEQGVGTANFIELLALGEGEYLVDNIEVVQGAANMLTTDNSTLNNGMGGWNGRGTHIRTTWEATNGVAGSGCLHVRSSARGDTLGNRVICGIAIPSGVVTLRAQVKWLSGFPEFLLRLHGNHYEAYGRLNIPKNFGTPGARNSRAVDNAGPAIAKVVHSPVLPAENEQTLVTARISDLDGVASATLFYRLDPSTTYSQAPMVDNGTLGDLIAGDGVYTGVIPGQTNGTMVAFYVQAADDRGAITTMPRAPSPTGFECLVRFGEPTLTTSFGIYRQWFTQNNVNTWRNRPALSNEKIFGTFIYGNVRVIYNHSAKYSSSPYHQDQEAAGPLTASCHYAMDMPGDDQCLGTDNWNKVHAPGNSAFDENTNQREQIGYWFARQMGLPWNYRRYVHMFVNGNKKGTSGQIMEDTERGGDDFVDSRFPDDNNGLLYKIQPWFEIDDGTANSLGYANQNWCTLNRYPTGTNTAVQYPPRYRNNWLVRAANGSANNFGPVFNVVDAANTPTNGWTAHTAAMEGVANMEEWMRIFATCHSVGDWDHFGTQNSQNMYGYQPEHGKFTLMIWDFNILMGNSGSWSPGQNLFVVNGSDNRMPWLYSNPKFRRMFLRGLREMAEVHMTATSVEPMIDARQNAFTAGGVNVPIGNVNTFKQWIRDARTEILRQVNLEDTNRFIVAGSGSISTTSNMVILSGVAPVNVHTLRVNDISYDITWSTVRNWALRLVVDQPTTVLDIRGYDINGNPITGMTGLVTINYSGALLNPQGTLVINEIMYNPQTPDASFIEIYNRSPSFAFNLSGWRVNGIGYTFKPGSIISPGDYLVLAKNSGALSGSFGPVNVFDTFDGSLDNGGETITLIKPAGDPHSEADDIVVDKVKYDDDAPWPKAADGGGPSLQLSDAEEDNARVSNWHDGSGWRYVTFQGTIQGSASAGSRGTNFFFYLNTAGEVFIDDMKLVAGTVAEAGPNILLNGDFEQPFGPEWVALGNHSGSAQSTVVSHSGSGSLRLVATGNGSTTQQYLRQYIPGRITNYTATLSFWMLPSTNGSTFTIRTAPGANFNKGDFSMRPVFATPGAPNTLTRDLPPYPLLWINEIQAVNPNGVRDNLNEAEPWIELFNSGNTAINLDGFFLTDNFNVLNKWAFPAGASINPGEYKLIWADNQPGQTTASDWHATVTLNAPTGAVALARSLPGGELQIVDYLKYAGQQSARSYGKYPDAQPFTDQVFFQPTPGAANVAGGTFVFINEWMALNTHTLRDPADFLYQDWIELHNAGTEPADISGYGLTDDLTTPNEYNFPDGTIIPPGGYLLVWADNQSNQEGPGQLHATFGLSGTGDEINLFSPAGALVDRVDFNGLRQTNDVSMGRFPDASGPVVFMTSPTPAARNIYSTGGSNQPPNLLPIGDKYVILGETLSFTANAS
ncbi:MAG TPA: lamin tail domain-containing protein, partial [Candidatus Binatia bacterium]|nr:lamin tail domain-containing protein [Candidatus Binatia bacterium]